jgi:hypothetical protein
MFCRRNRRRAIYGGRLERGKFVTKGNDERPGDTWLAVEFAVAAGILGWVLDAIYFFIVIFLFGTLAKDIEVSKAAIVFTLTIHLQRLLNTRCVTTWAIRGLGPRLNAV